MLSPVSLTPAINCSPVSTTPAINCIDDRGLLLMQNSGRRSRPRPPKSAKATEVGQGRRYCHCHENAQRHLTYPDQNPGGRQNYFKPKRHYLVLAASGASDQDVWGVFRCNFSWRFQWHHRRPWPTSAAGDVADLSPSTFSYPWQLPASKASFVLVIGNKFIAGDNCSPLSMSPAIKLSPVSLSPAINCSPVSTTPAITENPWQRLIAGVNDTGDKFFAGVVDTAEQFITGVVDTADKH